jgi:hypothetical protein
MVNERKGLANPFFTFEKPSLLTLWWWHDDPILPPLVRVVVLPLAP